MKKKRRNHYDESLKLLLSRCPLIATDTLYEVGKQKGNMAGNVRSYYTENPSRTTNISAWATYVHPI